jgi:plasmid stabilization system protein ParE
MTRFRLSPEAAQDLIDIYEYIAQDNLEAAERVRTEISDAMLGLAAMPGKGHRREDLTSQPVLFWPVRSYQIIYRPHSQPLQVVAVLHGKRNIKRILTQR